MTRLLILDKELASDGVILCYRGQISQEITETLGGVIREQWGRDGHSDNSGRTLFSVFIEMVQNIAHYACKPDGSPDPGNLSSNGIVLVGNGTTGAYVLSGNYMQSSRKPYLDHELATLKGMSKDELKAYYRQQRRSDPGVHSKGAGLGFIEMARKASDIQYEFETVSEEIVFFSLKVSL